MPSDPEGGNEREIGGLVSASRIGYEFVGTVLGCGAVGWIADHFLGSSPWGVLGMMFAEFAVGMFNLWKALNSRK